MNNCKKGRIKNQLIIFMWRVGKFLTDMATISRETNTPIYIETFRTGADLFDVMGKCVYKISNYKSLFPATEEFVKALDGCQYDNFDVALDYAHEFCKDFINFLKEHDLMS